MCGGRELPPGYTPAAVKRISGPWRDLLLVLGLVAGFLLLRNVVLPFLGVPT